MNLDLYRYSDNGESTLGLLFVNKKFQCYTIEDAHRDNKIAGKTRIPAGYHKIRLRTDGGMTRRYANKFQSFHRGMLWLQDVDNFTWVYIHIGNGAKDTEGCILVANNSNNNNVENGFIGDSTSAYKDLYRLIIEAMDRGEQVFIQIHDEVK